MSPMQQQQWCPPVCQTQSYDQIQTPHTMPDTIHHQNQTQWFGQTLGFCQGKVVECMYGGGGVFT